ncbi:MAG: hypothetical protein PHT48_09625 [Dechloromonas sp.]|nr:hypothetical protein [Dechloromonas sp.]
MSFATDMLAKAQTAYSDALPLHVSQMRDRRGQTHDIDALRRQVEYWQQQVDIETAKASGNNPRKPFQVVL